MHLRLSMTWNAKDTRSAQSAFCFSSVLAFLLADI